MVGGEFTQVQKNAFRWPDRLKQAVAICNALTLINKNHVVGDIAEKEAFQAVEAQFLVKLPPAAAAVVAWDVTL